MSDTIDSYMPEVRLHLPGVPDITAEDFIYRAMQHVAHSTRAMTTVADTAFVSGTATMAFDGVPTNTRVLDVNKVYFVKDATDGLSTDELTPLKKAPPGLMGQYLSDAITTDTAPRVYSITAAGTLAVYPFVIPDATGTPYLRAELVVQPNFSTTLPDSTYQFTGFTPYFYRAEEAIKHYALYLLKSMPGKTWSNITQSQVHRAMAQQEMDVLQILAPDGGVPNVPRAVRYGGY